MNDLTLGQKQRLFASAVARLILWSYAQGYEISIGEVWRPPETAKIYANRGIGIENSVHCDKLAVDLNLFLNGKLLTKTQEYALVGKKWKSLHPLARWGGDFRRADGNHFSFEHNGRA